ncbi:MAG: glycosyltransferase family 2 protein [Vicinamibacterales bacterium]
MALVFWGSVVFVVYAYVGYAACLVLLSKVRRRDVVKADITPRVTFIVAAHNEARRIEPKIANSLALDYPADRFEFLVASDCSSDATDDIVRQYADRGVRLIRAPERKGKENAQRLAIEAASGDVLVFSDVATMLDPEAIRHIVRNFADPSVGCVSSVDRMINADGQPVGEGAYVRYEMALRGLETQVNSLVGLSGSFFAARRAICTPWRTDIPSDFTTVLNAVRHGLRGVSDQDSVGYYKDLADPAREYGRKVRTIVRGVTALLKHLHLLNPFRYGLFAWQLASHKLCRWLVPFAMMAAAASNAVLAGRSAFYGVLAIGQVLFYVLAFVSLKSSVRWLRPARPIGFLVMANVSILDAWFRLARGRTVVAWTPSER